MPLSVAACCCVASRTASSTDTPPMGACDIGLAAPIARAPCPATRQGSSCCSTATAGPAAAASNAAVRADAAAAVAAAAMRRLRCCCCCCCCCSTASRAPLSSGRMTVAGADTTSVVPSGLAAAPAASAPLCSPGTESITAGPATSGCATACSGAALLCEACCCCGGCRCGCGCGCGCSCCCSCSSTAGALMAMSAAELPARRSFTRNACFSACTVTHEELLSIHHDDAELQVQLQTWRGWLFRLSQ
jgi:hypothetical protein